MSLANLGDGVRITAFPLLALTLTKDPVAVAGLAAMEFVPWVVFGPFAGVVVDRVDPRRLMLAVSWLRAVVLTGVTLMVLLGGAQLWTLYLAAVVLGVGECLYDTATQVAVPRVVAPAALPRANSLLSSAWITFNEFVGPFLGARLFELARSLPFLVHSAAMYLSAVLLIDRRRGTRDVEVPDRPPARPERRRIRTELADGFRAVLRDRVLRSIVLAGAAVAAADSAWYAVLVIYVTEEIGAGMSSFGVLLAVSAVGGIVGGLVMERVGSRVGEPTTLVVATTGVIAAQLGLVFAVDAVTVGALLVVSSMALAVWNIAAVTVRQRVARPEELGRVMGISRTVVSAASAVSAVLGGVLAQAIDVRAPFVLGIPLVLATSVWAIRVLRASPAGSPEPAADTASRT
ncbi:MFS transporter [Actinophytocola xanthii]|uniref:MFS transporter n=1 Tax=Actinophytocola xanthii TaxID=1912961 RepID=UPI000A4522B8|nr:MFS transporter [Actinophytocola xanthii]